MLVKLCSRDLARILQILAHSLGKVSPVTLLEPRQLYSSQLIVLVLSVTKKVAPVELAYLSSHHYPA